MDEQLERDLKLCLFGGPMFRSGKFFYKEKFNFFLESSFDFDPLSQRCSKAIFRRSFSLETSGNVHEIEFLKGKKYLRIFLFSFYREKKKKRFLYLHHIPILGLTPGKEGKPAAPLQARFGARCT